jgi:hypothetical protein
MWGGFGFRVRGDVLRPAPGRVQCLRTVAGFLFAPRAFSSAPEGRSDVSDTPYADPLRNPAKNFESNGAWHRTVREISRTATGQYVMMVFVTGRPCYG